MKSKFIQLRLQGVRDPFMSMANGKGGDAPPAPDYTAAANATAAGNLEAAKYTTQANRVNQVTPYGNLTYTQGGGGLNQPAYDAAMKNYQQQLDAYNQSQKSGTGLNNILGMAGSPLSGKGGNQMVAPVVPNIKDYTSDNNQWTATQTLTPAQQKILEQNQGLSSGLLGAAQKGLDYASGVIEKPGVDQSQLAQVGINPGENYSDAIMRRLAPQIQQESQASDAQLANQGIAPGTEAYANAKRQLAQSQNDRQVAAITGGMNVGLNANQQGFQQSAYNQMQPINVINALRTGSQVSSPSYVNPAQMQNPGGADILGATQAGYNAQLAQSNANNAANSGFMGGLMNLGGAALMSPAGTFTGSDQSIKENISKIGSLDNGINLYRFEYRPEYKDTWGHGSHIGVMAQEVEKVIPEAVTTHKDGYKLVNYAML
jgi:hypothetical protein